MADNFGEFRPDWVVGTLTLTLGSKNFTATNAQLLLAAIRDGDTIITPGGLTLPIESINANGNGGVLAQNAPAAAAGTYATRIRYQSDNSRFTGTLAALVARMAGGNLQSIAGLTGAADKGLMFTGAGTAGTFDLTAAARVLLKLAGTAAVNKLPFLDSANSAALTDLSPYVRTTLLGLLNSRAFWDAIAGASTLTTPVGRFPLGNGVLFQYGRDVLDPVGAFNPQTVGGTTYYTHYYRRVLPLTYTKWFIVFGSYLAGSFNSQIPSAGRQFNIGRDGTELDRFVMSFTQPGTGAVPAVSWWTVGE